MKKQASLWAWLGCALLLLARPAAAQNAGYAVLILGDLHFDHAAYHDPAVVRKASSARQQEYQRSFAVWDGPAQRLLKAASAARWQGVVPRFAIQLGDLTQGDCNGVQRSTRMCADAYKVIQQAFRPRFCYLVKGNHDTAGNGQAEAWQKEILAPLQKSVGRRASWNGASYYFDVGPDRFICFDSIDAPSLAFARQALAPRPQGRWTIFCSHLPIIPACGWTGTPWVPFNKDAAARAELRRLLAARRAIVLIAHTHTFSCFRYEHPGEGAFVQACLNSVAVPDALGALKPYGDNTVASYERWCRIPHWTQDQRTDVLSLVQEYQPWLRQFQIWNGAGFGILLLDSRQVRLQLYGGLAAAPAGVPLECNPSH